MKNILTAVMAKLKSSVPKIQYIGEDWGQIDNYGDIPPVKFPCALLSIGKVQFETITKDRRRANITFHIRIADTPPTVGNMTAPGTHIDRAFEIFEIMENIESVLSGLSDETFSNIHAQEIIRYAREDNIREYLMVLRSGYLLS